MQTAFEIPVIDDQHAFNMRRWREVAADSTLAALDHRIETDRFGQIIMTPPPGFDHGDRQFDIGFHLRRLLPAGKVVTECPISTFGGVKAADVTWISEERLKTAREGDLLVVAPEICVEILSPSNTRGEMDEKKRLYFEAGAEEVWVCDLEGKIRFFLKADPELAVGASRLCREFSVKFHSSDS